jgi:uncharacterized protein YcbX
MLIGYDLKLALFQASIDYDKSQIAVKWNTDESEDSIHFPLKPSLEGRPIVEASLHASNTKAYDMGDDLSKWFSDRIGQEVRLVYIGDGSRAVLGSLAPHSSDALQKASFIQRIKSNIPFLAHSPERLAFNDIAHYLVVTEESNNEVSSRLKEGYSMDITKFRPNIVLRGASAPFVEDYWGDLSFYGGVRMALTANCFRCQSITVDYETGKTAIDERGMVWKKLNKDRRVDKGAKYSPVFGRYGFCYGDDTNKSLSVGQRVDVTQINKERTTFGESDSSENEWVLTVQTGLSLAPSEFHRRNELSCLEVETGFVFSAQLHRMISVKQLFRACVGVMRNAQLLAVHWGAENEICCSFVRHCYLFGKALFIPLGRPVVDASGRVGMDKLAFFAT